MDFVIFSRVDGLFGQTAFLPIFDIKYKCDILFDLSYIYFSGRLNNVNLTYDMWKTPWNLIFSKYCCKHGPGTHFSQMLEWPYPNFWSTGSSRYNIRWPWKLVYEENLLLSIGNTFHTISIVFLFWRFDPWTWSALKCCQNMWQFPIFESQYPLMC